MNLQEATELISHEYITSLRYPTTWADLGCGDGLFTRALAGLLQPGSTIFGIDKKPGFASSVLSNGTAIKAVTADFETDELPFEAGDGILMANSFHYIQEKEQLIRKLSQRCKTDAAFIVVEYQTRLANKWVPYPIDFSLLEQLFKTAGFSSIKQIGKRPSLYRNGFMYAALAIK
jgi:SAM-dependent methyltransferase